ncbi:uncharacterized protein LOC126996073 [Eriocheir sinensis]|uniref:uncharacterized protein LOC126996073 n=1 Tax=Eriocheir sinensis TaxID=95602 RepID=UPI0021CA56A4|nr:uncharacterized protein LOC126996073 [Eriocheir sinensis]
MMGSKPVTICVTAVVVAAGWWCLQAAAQSTFKGPLLSSFKGVTQTASQGPQGSYKFSFSLPQQERLEHRDEQGKVTGTYSFVDKVGREVSVTYDADHNGFRARSDALPQPPQDTPDVAKAKEEFLRHYERTARLLRVLEEKEEEEDSQSSEEDEESDENSDEDSDEDEDDDDSSSEEDVNSDEDDDDDSEGDSDDSDEEEEDDEEDEEKYEEKEDNLGRTLEYEEENELEDDEKEYGKRIQEEENEEEADDDDEEQDEDKQQVQLRLINVSSPGRPKIFPLPLPVHVRENTGRRFTFPTSFLPPLTPTPTNSLLGSFPRRQ